MATGIYYQTAFAASGDQTSIPVSGTEVGTINFLYGYGSNYSASIQSNPSALTVDRLTFNYLLNTITGNWQALYQVGAVPFITSAMNGGTSYSYAVNALCQGPDLSLWFNYGATNTATPGTANSSWALFNPTWYPHKGTLPLASVTGGTYSFATTGTGCTLTYTVSGGVINAVSAVAAGGTGYSVGDLIMPNGGNYDAVIRVLTVSSGAVATVVILYGGTGFAAGTAAATQKASARFGKITLAGTLTSNATFIMPNGPYLRDAKTWIVGNNTTGAFISTIFVSNGSNATTGSGIAIPQSSATNNAEVIIDTDGVTDFWFAHPTTTIGTPAATVTGTQVLISNIPTTAKKVTMNFVGVTIASSTARIQLGSASTFTTSGYVGGASQITTGGTPTALADTAGFILNGAAGAYVYNGSITLTLENATNNTWCAAGSFWCSGAATAVSTVGGSISLSGPINQIKLTTVTGVALFSAGEVNTSYQ